MTYAAANSHQASSVNPRVSHHTRGKNHGTGCRTGCRHWRQRTDTSINIEKYLFKKKINFIASKATNIDAEIADKQPKETATWNAICLADMGNTGAAFVAILQIPPRNITWFKEGKWVHLAKLAYEKYFLNKMKRGGTEPVYEKYILKMLGINRLKSEE